MDHKDGLRHSRGRVVWDEENLDYLEASKTPKQKINEPKTPYYAPAAEDGLGSPSPTEESAPMVDAEAVRHALTEVASTGGSGWTSSEDEAEDMEDDSAALESNGRRRSFEEHRRLHYDEYRQAKMLSENEMSDEETEMGAENGERHLSGGSSFRGQSHEDH